MLATEDDRLVRVVELVGLRAGSAVAALVKVGPALELARYCFPAGGLQPGTVRSQTARFALDNAATRWACVLRARRAAGESRQRHLFHTSTMFRSSGETNARGAPPPGSRCPPMVCSNWTFRPPRRAAYEIAPTTQAAA